MIRVCLKPENMHHLMIVVSKQMREARFKHGIDIQQYTNIEKDNIMYI